MMMEPGTNEQLCAELKQGNRAALDTLLEQNLRFLQQSANIMAIKAKHTELTEDLIQEGRIGLMEAAERFDPERGTAFLTYAGFWIKKRMQEYLIDLFRHRAISLQEITNLEDSGVQDFSGNGYVQSSEAIILRKERMEELYQGIRAISDRDRTYLFYRYGFPDEPENRTLKETAAHFHLSQSRAKSTEKKALEDLRLELPWWHR